MSTTASLQSDTPSRRPHTPAKDLEQGSAAPATAATPSVVPNAPPPEHDHDRNYVSNTGGQGRLSRTSGELAWNPQHPCYPHANPHVPLANPLHATTKVIRIPRDWMVVGDLAPCFSNTYPEILEPWVSEEDFRLLIKGVNERLIEAFDPLGWRAWVDAGLGLATGWLWEDFGGAGVKKGCRAAEAFMEQWNGVRKQGLEKEDDDLVRAIPLRRTGYTSLDIQIPDPKVGMAGEGNEGSVNGAAEGKE